MADFPQSHTTTTTTTTITSARIQLDVSYIKTISGILHIAEIIICIILFICAVSACSVIYNFSECGWSAFVAFMGFLLALVFLLFALFHIQEAVPRVPWLLIQLIIYAIWTFFFLTCVIALSVLASKAAAYIYGGRVQAGAGAGAFFAVVAMFLFGFHTFLIFRDWRSQATVTRGQGGHA